MRRIRLTPATRRMCAQMVMDAPEGYMFTPPQEPTRNLEQNAKLHAMCADISRQKEWAGRKWGVDDWKRLLVDAWMRDSGRAGRHVVPGLGHDGIVTLGVQTHTLGVKAMAELITSIQAWGDSNGVQWSEQIEVPAWA